MPELDKEYIISKIERAHRVNSNNYGTILPVIGTGAINGIIKECHSSPLSITSFSI